MSSVIEWLADSLFAGSIVMLIVMFIRGVILRRMPRRYAYLLWAVVAVRLICPVSIRSPLSIFNYVPEVKIVQEHSSL
ncbi:MAG: M56 family metallopeptidase [Eubacterium sp.]|nr:M56 family metallopeptidase [Eubacterium sp.]